MELTTGMLSLFGAKTAAEDHQVILSAVRARAAKAAASAMRKHIQAGLRDIDAIIAKAMPSGEAAMGIVQIRLPTG
jgi:DNA-binding GntR family transcriptional regulator